MNENEIIIEDDSDAWNHQLEIEERQQRESQTLDSQTQEVIEDLSKAIAILSNVPRNTYPVIADLAKRLKIEREFLRTRQNLSLNNLVKTARRLLHGR
jgi:pantothenate kinase type III